MSNDLVVVPTAAVTIGFVRLLLGPVMFLVGALLAGALIVGFPWFHRFSRAFAGLVRPGCGLAARPGLSRDGLNCSRLSA